MSPTFRVRGQYRRRRDRKDVLPVSITFIILSLLALTTLHHRHQRHPQKLQSNILHPTMRSASYGDLCSNDDIFSRKSSLALSIPLVVFTFMGLAIVTDDYFVAALERICERLDLSPDVAGATFMAAGSSTPEFFASMIGVFVTEDQVGIGTIVGSAVFNILVIIGLSAALAGAVLKLDWRPLLRDSFFYIISIILLLIFVLPSTKGVIDWWEGLILVMGYVVYVLFMAYGNSRYMKWAGALGKKEEVVDEEAGQCGVQDVDVDIENIITDFRSSVSFTEGRKCKYSELSPRTKFRAAQLAVIAAHRLASSSSTRSIDGEDERDENETGCSGGRSSRKVRGSFLGVDLPQSKVGWIFFPATCAWKVVFRSTIVDCASDKKAKWWWLTFLMSIVWISGISYVMVESARLSGCLLGISATAMGLTVIAAGTSVPDALASVSVARDGAGDMAVSNAIGSNVFDILLGLGLPWFLGDLIKGEKSQVTVDPIAAVVIPILILFAIIVLLLVLMVLLRWQLRPVLGYTLFGVYGLFVLYTLLDVSVFKFSTTDE